MSGFPVIYDPLPAIRDLLVDDTALASACTGGTIKQTDRIAEVRIYAEELPDPPIVHGTLVSVLPKTVLVIPAGGGNDRDLSVLSRPRVEIRCYAPTRALARALWYQALNVLRTSQPVLETNFWISPLLSHSGPNTGRELSTNWPLATGMVPFLVIGD